ncbi:TlpA disulfide reductase family protein [Persicobacter psychrovividus]|uniref:Thiol:disulfide interchange protein n=1 Tax=Persicobacter psychrovividus TaxID=387638 RepID=A0ABM7VIN8_9BACT|nr:thiol:disulfide interchange protein [Persicobacter psychrovividus]
MKKTYFIILLGVMFLAQACQSNENSPWSVLLHLPKLPVKQAYLFKMDINRHQSLIDSAQITDGSVSFENTNASPRLSSYFVGFDRQSKGGVPFMIRNGNEMVIRVKGQFKNEYSGTSFSNEYNHYMATKQQEVDAMLGVMDLMNDTTLTQPEKDAGLKKIQEESKHREGQKVEVIGKISDAELSAALALEEVLTASVLDRGNFENYAAVLSDQAMATDYGHRLKEIIDFFPAYELNYNAGEEGFAAIEKGYQQLDEQNKQSEFGKALALKLKKLQALKIGNVPPALNAKTVDGKAFNLKQVKGKLILLDFWASWCGPCRLANPLYRKLYQQYHAKGFEIVSYSLDTDRGKWEKAIQKDQLNWTNVSNLKKQAEDVNLSNYQVSAIPANLLIQDGKIVGRNLYEAELSQFVQEHMKH